MKTELSKMFKSIPYYIRRISQYPELRGHSSQEFIPFYAVSEYMELFVNLDTPSIIPGHVVQSLKENNFTQPNFFFYLPDTTSHRIGSLSQLGDSLKYKNKGELKIKDRSLYLYPHFIMDSSENILLTCLVDLKKYLWLYLTKSVDEIKNSEIAKTIKILISGNLMFDPSLKNVLKRIQADYLSSLYDEGVCIEVMSAENIKQAIFAASLTGLPPSLEAQSKLLEVLQLNGQLWTEKE